MRILLNTGREISLVSLHQSLTYHGVLAGIPYREDNARRVKRLLDEAARLGPEGLAPGLIPPVIEPIAPPAAHPELLRRTGKTAEQHAAFREAMHQERLPAVACIGIFDSSELNTPEPEPYSSMVIVWIQNKFALPIDDGVLSQIQRRDWDALAKDWIW